MLFSSIFFNIKNIYTDFVFLFDYTILFINSIIL